MKIYSPEYILLKKFLAGVWPLIQSGPLPHELDPIFNLERLEREVPSRAGEGLQLAIDDILSRSVRLPKERIKNYDRILESKNCLTISGARIQYWKRLSRLLKANRLRTEADYYLLRVLYDDAAELFDTDESLVVLRLIEDFENRQGRVRTRR